MARERFDHKAIEQAAQETWDAAKLFETDLSDESKEPYYLLFEFPYPSGDLHIGHWYAYAITDIYARLLRMKGKNVLFPIGFDAFGLPAENAAMKQGADPKEWTYANMEKMRNQIRSIGSSVDWSKEVVTCDPTYYKWTQWLFAKLYEHGLAERKNAAVKWCPKDATVLANEQVIDGKCERCDTPVEEKVLTQWFMGITKYADRLLSDLDALPWREDIKEAQRQWIGKSEGAKLWFPIVGSDQKIEVFTTRPDTIFGATYVVLAPEHPLLNELMSRVSNEDEVTAYREKTKKKTERERSENKEKTGVRLEGVMAVNPGTKEEIPVYVADYVLGSYGTGAVMAVPAHDERDFEFAKKYDLPIRAVVAKTYKPGGDDADRPGLETRKSKVVDAIIHDADGNFYLIKENDQVHFAGGGIENQETELDALAREIREETGFTDFTIGRKIFPAISYQGYRHGKNRNQHSIGYAYDVVLASSKRIDSEIEAGQHELIKVSSDEVLSSVTWEHHRYLFEQYLKNDGAYTEDGALINSGEFDGRDNREAMWDIVAAVGGERTTNYRIRDWLVSRQRYWGCPIPVVYDPEGTPHIIPAEHLPWLLPDDVDFKPTGKAPLASSRELHERVTRIFGEGWTPEYDTLDTFVDSSWYFLRYLDPKDDTEFSDAALMKKWFPVNRYSGGSEHTTMHLLYARFFHKALYDLSLTPTPEPFNERFNRGIILGPDGRKMSKRWGNVINPDEMLKEYGADAVRMYLGFVGPYNEPGHYPWNLDGVVAMRRFLERVYRLRERVTDEVETNELLMRSLAKTSHKVSEDADRFKFNTAISALMVLLNDLEGQAVVTKNAYRSFLITLAPFAPHLAEHLWKEVGGEGSIHTIAWPAADPALLVEDMVGVVVQVNGKRKGEVQLAPDASEEEARAAALALPGVDEGEYKRLIYVPGRIINIVW